MQKALTIKLDIWYVKRKEHSFRSTERKEFFVVARQSAEKRDSLGKALRLLSWIVDAS